MDDPTCGFCHRGVMTADVCGQLYQHPDCTAHKRCMQYSAGLVQYRNHVGLGGFKVDKVKAEITRGSKLKCSLCSKSKSKHKSSGFPAKGATSGCAVSRCNKTFHYYCARKTKECVTQRMEVMVQDRDKKRKVVEYRVFCSKKHLNHYKDAKEKDNQYIRTPREESGSSSEGESVVKVIDRTKDASSFETESSSDESTHTKSSSNSKNGTKLRKRKQNGDKKSDAQPPRKKRKRKLSETDESSATSDESGATASPTKPKNSRKAKPKDSRKKSDASESQSGEELSSESAKAIGTLTPIEIERLKQKLETHGLGCQRFGLEKGSNKMIDRVSSCENLNPKTDCLLCYVEAAEIPPDVEYKLKRLASKIFKIPSASVYLQRRTGFQMTKEHTVYLLKDITLALRQGKWAEFEHLVLNVQDEDISKYNYIIATNNEYPPDLADTIYQKLRDAIRENMEAANQDLKKKIGTYIRVAHKQEQLRVALLSLSDQTDPEKKIRRAIHSPSTTNEIFQWVETTEAKIKDSITDGEESSKDREFQTLKQWLQIFEGSVIDGRPKDTVLLANYSNSISVQLLQYFKTAPNFNHTTNMIFIRPVDENIAKTKPYIKKLLETAFGEGESEYSSVVLVFDLVEGLTTYKDVLEQISADHVTVKVFSAFDPESTPVSCVVVQMTEKEPRPRVVYDSIVEEAANYDSSQEEESDFPEDTPFETRLRRHASSQLDQEPSCEVVGMESVPRVIMFMPPDLKWRIGKSTEQGLSVKSVGTPSAMMDPRPLTVPTKIKKIQGDGNCFFRAITLELTGDQSQHAKLRRRLVKYMLKNEEKFEKYFSMKSVDKYISRSGIAEDMTWATETEIIAMATMLDTDIVIYTRTGGSYRWLPYSPIGGDINDDYKIYLVNKGNHYDLVLSTR